MKKCLIYLFIFILVTGLPAEEQALSGYWSFDNSGKWIPDESGNGNNGKSARWNEKNTVLRGKSGKALRFMGNGDFIDLGTSNFNMDVTSELTISFWIYPNTGQTSSQFIIRKGKYLYPFGMDLLMQGGRFYIKGGIRCDRTHYVTSEDTITPAEWSHVALTYREPLLLLYINGKEAARKNVTGLMEVRGGEITYLGGFPDSKETASNITIDELQIYSQALEAGEIGKLFSGERKTLAKNIKERGNAALFGGDQRVYEISPSAYDPAAEGTLVISQETGGTVRLNWEFPGKTGETLLLKGESLGWSGTLKLLKDAAREDRVINVNKTSGLLKGDELHFRQGREDYYVEAIESKNKIRLTHPLHMTMGAASSSVNLSAAWAKDYSRYNLIHKADGSTGSFIDNAMDEGKDYFFTAALISEGKILSYTNPVHGRIIKGKLLFDAALASNGGYAWKVGQRYSDTPQLIDGERESIASRIQYALPTIITKNQRWLGFSRIQLNRSFPLKYLEISQDSEDDMVQAALIKLEFDDRSSKTITLDAFKTREEKINGRVFSRYLIPLNKSSSHISLSVEKITNNSGRQIQWSKVSLFTDRFIENPVTSASLLKTTEIKVDFSRKDGTLPALFGTDEIYDNTSGLENGWMLKSWAHTKKIFNIYRLHMSDIWPRSYGMDLIKIGELSADLSPGSSKISLTNTTSYFSRLTRGVKLKTGYELMRLDTAGKNFITLSERGSEKTLKKNHKKGAPVYAYKKTGAILRLQEIIPEFKVIKYSDAYISGLKPVDRNADVNSPLRTAVVDIIVNTEGFKKEDVIRIGSEIFKILNVKKHPVKRGQFILTVKRGFDGTNQRFIQHLYPVPDIYRLIDYEPYYEGFKNDPSDSKNYFWDNFKTSMDKVIHEGNAIPWLIAYSPMYATETRGKIARILTASNPGDIQNNIILDEYNSKNSNGHFWYNIAKGNKKGDYINTKGNNYQYRNCELHILTGKGAGRVFYLRSHDEKSFSVVRSWNDSDWRNTSPEFVDLQKEGIKPGDVYKLTQGSNRVYGSPTRRFWQYNGAIFHSITKYIRKTYKKELAENPIYIEYFLEPNLGIYGTWNKDAYIDSYSILADTVRNGGTYFKTGFGPDEVLIGAGSIAGGLNPGVKMPGTAGDYDLALSLIDRAKVLDFVSHHRYYVGSRVQKRENSWEYRMLREYAASKGKNIFIADSEDSVATAGGTGREQAKHWARFGVPYWSSNFINSYYGDMGPLGRLALILHFRLYFANDTSLGFVAADKQEEPIYDLVYWPIKMYLDHTSNNPTAPDDLAYTIRGGDPFGWIQAMGTIHGETGVKHLHLVNKKESPVTVKIELTGIRQGSEYTLKSIVGSGPNQSIKDGYHPIGLTGVIKEQRIKDYRSIVLEPQSTNILVIQER